MDTEQEEVTPVVGMGATRYNGSDRYPFTIIKVINKNSVVVQEDNAKLIAGSHDDEHQDYEFTPNPKSREITITKRKNGMWCEVGQSMNSTPFAIGGRSRYYDPCF